MADPLPTSSGGRFTMEGVRKRFEGTVALDGVDLTVASGEVHALVGENGAGKSTLMKILSGAYAPDAGTMTLYGRPYRPRNPLDARRAGIAMIYQELAIAPHLSVAENILLGMEPQRFGFLRWRSLRAKVEATLAKLEHPEIRPETMAGRLSIAAQQLVEIARALASGCRVLVLDEPTSTLTRADATRLFDLIRSLRADGLAIVYISHVLEEVETVADRYTVLRDGRTVSSGRIADTSPSEMAQMMVGRPMTDLYPHTSRRAGEAVLDVRNLAGAGKPTSASFTLHRGEVLGIAGLVGAGRTELLRAIFGLDPVRRGAIRVAEYAGPATPADRWAEAVGLVSEDRGNEGLAADLSVADNLTLTYLRGLGPAGLVRPRHQDRHAAHWIHRLGIRCRGPRQRVRELSGGNQQKVAFGRLLYHDVDVLLLDEPTRGIDVGSKAEIYQLIDALATGDPSRNRRPRAVLMVSSYLPELLGVCDRVAVMDRGVLRPPRPTSELDEHAVMLEATGQGGST